MSIDREAVSLRDLVDEAKKRVVFLGICVVGLSYLMSLTSTSVLVNLPVAASLIFILRYISLDFEMRRKTAAYNSKQSSVHNRSHIKLAAVSKKPDWRRKVDSPAVEGAIDQFTRHVVSEWVTDMWYSRLTPDKEAPEELVQIINALLGEISHRARSINLIDLLTRDIISLICTHLELFRACQAKINNEHLQSLTIDQRDMQLKLILAVDNKLHPALISAESEHKVLQHLMDGLISLTFKYEDLQCTFFHYIARELLACAVIRPVLNLASPRFINGRIESLALSVNKASKGSETEQEVYNSKNNVSSKLSSDHFSLSPDPSVTGVELVQLKNKQSQTAVDRNVNGVFHQKDPLLSIDAQTTLSWNEQHHSGSEWGDVLDLMSHRKTQALAPEHFESMWTKGKNCRKENLNGQGIQKDNQKDTSADSKFSDDNQKDTTTCNLNNNAVRSTSSSIISYPKYEAPFEEVESGSDSSYTTDDDDESSSVTGLDSPGTMVWDGRKNRNVSVSHIRHPLESSEVHARKARNSVKSHIHYHRLSRSQSSRKRSKLNSQKLPVLQEVQRSSLTFGDGQDILSSLQGHTVAEDSSDDSAISLPQNQVLAVDSSRNSFFADSFFSLQCEVLGANIVKSGSKMLAVYSISVTDVNNNVWSIKRRFRHFEELHRRLKGFAQYNLHLPPKHILSTGLDMSVIQERCKLLDKYLKSLLNIPTISGSIEVWDFLSVDSQTYMFSNSISIVETLSADLDGNKPPSKTKKGPNFIETANNNSTSTGRGSGRKESMQMKHNLLDTNDLAHSVEKKPSCSRKTIDDTITASDSKMQNLVTPKSELRKSPNGRNSESPHGRLHDASCDPVLPTEWVPPNLSVPILDMVDVIFQLQDGGWIRRKLFWVAKQVLQLGMGDAFDDWLIDKIQLLRRGSVISYGIRRVEQILWPDGIFITKHPQRQRPPPFASSPSLSKNGNGDVNGVSWDEHQKQEADERAKFVYELMIDNAPAALVSLIGRKEYEQCTKDLYFFIQSSVFIKQLGFGIVELLLLSAFPELDHVCAQLHEDTHKFGKMKTDTD